MKEKESFLVLSEHQVITGLILLFFTGLILFFAGLTWGKHSEKARMQYDFTGELKRSLKAYTRNSFDDDCLQEDFDTDSGILEDDTGDSGINQS